MNSTNLLVILLKYRNQRFYPPLCRRRFVRSFGATTMSSGTFSDNNWRGVPLSELYGSQSPWGAPEFPLVSPGHNHAVLYHIPGSGMASDRPPKPQIGHDKWDQDHVRMPCSSHSLYPVEDANGESRLKKRWEIIENALWRPIRNSKELADAILSYNTKFNGVWKFRTMHKLFEEYLEEEESQYFFDVTLPEIAKLALALPKLVQSPIPLLKQHKNSSISLSQQQIASLLANAFFCTFPRRNTTKRSSEYATYPFINFNRLYESGGSEHVMEKLKCICHYFRRVCTKVSSGVVTFSRRSVRPALLPSWAASDVPLAALPLHVDPGNTIEQADGLIQVDFANKFLGGGVLNHGCVQEEIRFVISPELLVSMLFTEVLRPNEALLVIGTERYSTYSGYGHTFQWTGDYRDHTPLDSSHRRRCAVLAIDALPYSHAGQEFRRDMITRELNKAWIGFSFATDPQSTALNYPGVGTGNWGCGAFGGTPQLKSLLQMMACAQARRPMAYYTFNDIGIRDDVISIYNLLARYNVTVGQLYKYIIRFSQTDVRHTQLHAFLHQLLRDGDRRTPSSNEDRETTPSNEDRQTPSSNEDRQHSPSNEDRYPTSSKKDRYLTSSNEDRNPMCSNESTRPSNKDIRRLSLDKDKSVLAEDMTTFEETADIERNTTDERSKECERMDISTASESSHDVSSTIQRESPKNSPDLFTPPENEDCTLTDVRVQKDTELTNTENAKEKTAKSQPSRLIEEMQKLDEQSGRLNLSVTNTSPFKFNNVQGNDVNASMDRSLDTSHTDSAAEMKKRVSRKITDYFSKRTT